MTQNCPAQNNDDGAHGEPAYGLTGLMVAGPVVGGQEAAVLRRQEHVEGGEAVAGPALLQAEEAEAVDEADEGVVEEDLPPAGAELGLLPHHPTSHHQPVHN
jgi:hypothetical protein